MEATAMESKTEPTVGIRAEIMLQVDRDALHRTLRELNLAAAVLGIPRGAPGYADGRGDPVRIGVRKNRGGRPAGYIRIGDQADANSVEVEIGAVRADASRDAEIGWIEINRGVLEAAAAPGSRDVLLHATAPVHPRAAEIQRIDIEADRLNVETAGRVYGGPEPDDTGAEARRVRVQYGDLAGHLSRCRLSARGVWINVPDPIDSDGASVFSTLAAGGGRTVYIGKIPAARWVQGEEDGVEKPHAVFIPGRVCSALLENGRWFRSFDWIEITNRLHGRSGRAGRVDGGAGFRWTDVGMPEAGPEEELRNTDETSIEIVTAALRTAAELERAADAAAGRDPRDSNILIDLTTGDIVGGSCSADGWTGRPARHAVDGRGTRYAQVNAEAVLQWSPEEGWTTVVLEEPPEDGTGRGPRLRLTMAWESEGKLIIDDVAVMDDEQDAETGEAKAQKNSEAEAGDAR